MVKTVSSLAELRDIAQKFLITLSTKAPKEQGVLVGLSGDLGTGKTAFTKCVAEVLGISETVTSPTFVLEKRYSIPEGSIVGRRFTKLIHIDAYRLNEGSEMNVLDWASTLASGQNLILLEWPEQVKEALPKNMVNITFKYIDEGVRQISGDYIE